ncbi:hypothetical protein [Roseicella aerolata]|uniref:Uncharacterized protein n=1 Tax=Roseicella aerolata TaxID=2883479 RepID=A0A9X1IK04_9PROT|nr:hypothetical protein [Roseicella aerolata]MCB4825569.1 hypothetical protein [Roseicella aerolata]
MAYSLLRRAGNGDLSFTQYRQSVGDELIDLAALPVRVDRRAGAELVTKHFFPVSHRSLEVWPLTWRHINGKALCETEELVAVARAKLKAATPIRGGRRGAKEAA